MRSPSQYSLRCVTLLTLLCNRQVLARPQIVPEFYTIINGVQSFLSVVREDATTGPANQGGPAVSTVIIVNPPVFMTIATTIATTIPNPNVVTITHSNVVIQPMPAANTNPVIVVNTVTATIGATVQATVVVPAAAQTSVVLSVQTPQAVNQAPNGGIFLQQSASVGIPSLATLSVAGNTFTTLVTVPTTQVSIIPHTVVAAVPTAAPAAIATVVPAYTSNNNLPCYGDDNTLTAFEQANIGKPMTWQIKNSCPMTIWPALTYREWPNSPSITSFEVGALAPYSSPFTWANAPYWMTSARMWAKEGCDANGNNCIVDAGNAPTLFEWTTYPDSYASCAAEINYDISLVDGHTIPIGVSFDSPTCAPRTCTASKTVGGTCPKLNTIAGAVEGCFSSCAYLQSIGITSGDAFELACCTGAHNTEATCPPSSAWFATACPEAYSYAYDDVAANRACSLPGVITIEYCPDGSVP